MAKALVKLKHEGLSGEKQPFDAIYGDYSISSDGYVFGAYTVPFDNISSVFVGVVENNIKGTLVL